MKHTLRVSLFAAAGITIGAVSNSFANHPQRDSTNSTLDSLILNLSNNQQGWNFLIDTSGLYLDPNDISQALANITPSTAPKVTPEYYSDGKTRFFIRNPMKVHLEGQVSTPDGTRKNKDYYFDGDKRYYIENPDIPSIGMSGTVVPWKNK